MITKIAKSNLQGSIYAPASKSYFQRAVAVSLLSKAKTEISNIPSSDDCLAALGIAEQLGAKIIRKQNKVIIQGDYTIKNNNLNCGESGLGMRMFSPIAALGKKEISIHGEGSLLKRPLSSIEDALKQLGVKTQSNKGFLPLKIKGPIKGGSIQIDGSLSSQVLTGLLIALPFSKQDSVVFVDHLKSIPYVEMTLSLLEKFGIEIETDNSYEVFAISGNQEAKSTKLQTEGDWSGAAFILTAGALFGNLEVKGLQHDSSQADIKILDALKKAGIKYSKTEDGYAVFKGKANAFEFDATHCPDLFPPLACLAAFANGKSIISGIERLSHKESNRAETISCEFTKMGIPIHLENNNMIIEGVEHIKACVTDSHNDHRIAMANAVCGLASEEGISIQKAESINKSYPDFFNHLKQLGGNIYV